MTELVRNPLGLTAQDAIAGIGMGAAVPLSVRAMLPAGAPTQPQHLCHHCGTGATLSWQREATDDEREGYWNAIELNIRSQPNLFDDQNAAYTADRTQTVTKAVYGCDEHQVPDATLLHAAGCGGHQACSCTDKLSQEI